jgi:hypothetical protein
MKFIDKYFWYILAVITVVVVAVYRKSLFPNLVIPGIDPKKDGGGEVDPKTGKVQKPEIVDGLNINKILKRGDTGPEVKALQAALNNNGASPVLTVDGQFGKKTESALLLQAGVTEVSLKKFQALTGLKGIVSGLENTIIPFKPGYGGGTSANTGFVPGYIKNA